VMDAMTVALQRWSRERRASLRPALRALARIFPALELVVEESRPGEPVTDEEAIDPRELRRRAFDGLVRLLAHWQGEGPILLVLAAAAGGDVPGSLLRDVSGLSASEYDLAAGELMAARFLKTVPGGPVFSGRGRGAVDDSPRVDLYHDRIREVVYRGLDEDRR